jgi:hypothetical protein
MDKMRDKIICYQFAERIKSELIIGSKLLMVMETLKGEELEGAKKLIMFFFDALSAETRIASNVTSVAEFGLLEEKMTLIKRKIDEGSYQEANENIGRATSHATTACERMMRVLMENGLM